MSDGPALYARKPGIEERWIAESAFLADPATDRLFQRNATGAAIWRLLREPTGLDDAVAVLADAFPGIPRERIAADVRTWLSELARRGLALPR